MVHTGMLSELIDTLNSFYTSFDYRFVRLKDRFKNFRRLMSCSRYMISTSIGEPKPKKGRRGSAIEEPPEIADGKDDISYQQHVQS